MRNLISHTRTAWLISALVPACLAVGCASSWLHGDAGGPGAGGCEVQRSCCSDGSCSKCSPPGYCCPWYLDCFDDLLFQKKAWHCADDALDRYEEHSGCDTSGDFRAGVRQAYSDLADGSWGMMPPVPPEEYWKAEHRQPGGRSAVRDWYAGYSAGLDWARQDGLDRYRTVAVP